MNVRELFRLDGKVAIVTGGSRGLGTKDDIKGVAVFLCSAAANYLTGQTLAVDGGVVI